jgi:hypothetical protein
MSDSERNAYLNNLDNASKDIRNKYSQIVTELDLAIAEYKE